MNKELDEYPKLKEEISKKEKALSLQYVDEDEANQIELELQKEEEEAKKKGKKLSDPYRFAGYDPNVIDFIRRCDTNEQAFEIIDFLENKGEITSKEASNLKKQIQNKGLRSFGEKKESGFYFKKNL